jgi:hypothetical protein
MRRSIFVRAGSHPTLLGLLAGGATSVAVAAVAFGATAVAQPEQAPPPHSLLEATHLPPLLVMSGEPVSLAFDVHCAQAGVEDPEQSCRLSGSLFVRGASAGPFRELALAEDDAAGLRRVDAAVPDVVAHDPKGFEYYAEIEASGSGDRVRVPAGADAAYHTYVARNAVAVELPPRPFGSVRRGSRVISARWGDGPLQVGLESGPNADPIGASSFDVDASGTVVLLDEAHRRALRFAPTAHVPEVIPLAIDGHLADLTIDENESMDVLESVAPPGGGPFVRRFDRAGRSLGAVETAERSPSQIRMGPNGPVVLEHPSHLWVPVAANGVSLRPADQLRHGRVGHPLRSGAEVVVHRTVNELRLALVSRGRIQTSWRIASPAHLGEVQLAEPLDDRLVVVVRAYDEHSDEFRVLVLDRRGPVQQFAVESADWAETAPLSRFRLIGGSLYQLGSDPAGAFVDRYDLEVR